MITLLAKRILTSHLEDFLFEYSCERDIELEAIYVYDFKSVAISSVNMSETIIESHYFGSGTFASNPIPPPNKRFLQLNYRFKKGDVIKGRAYPIAPVTQYAMILLIEKRDGFDFGKDFARFKSDSKKRLQA